VSAFDDAFDELIGLEGGYSDDERDPGNWTGGKVGVGELKGTNWGISASQYPKLDIRSLTRDQAKSIYHSDFWGAMHLDAVPAQVAKAVFKFGVNEGPKTAVMLLQKALKIKQDGDIGQITIGIINQTPLREVVVDFCAEAALHYTGLPGFAVEGRGWLRRAVRTAVESAPC
jgi:lysozyme family protein